LSPPSFDSEFLGLKKGKIKINYRARKEKKKGRRRRRRRRRRKRKTELLQKGQRVLGFSFQPFFSLSLSLLALSLCLCLSLCRGKKNRYGPHIHQALPAFVRQERDEDPHGGP
jgi:hypothetical protein